MKRRDIVIGLGLGATGLSGCLSRGSQETDGGSTRTPPTCESPEPRHFKLGETRSIPDKAKVSISVSIEQNRPTSEKPAVLQMRLVNEGQRRKFGFQNDVLCHPFNREDSFSEPRGLRLKHPNSQKDERAGNCWTRDAVPYERNPGWDGYECSRSWIGRDESKTYTFEIWDDYRIDNYTPTGTYRFTSDLLKISGIENFRWWFECVVSNPER